MRTKIQNELFFKFNDKDRNKGVADFGPYVL